MWILILCLKIFTAQDFNCNLQQAPFDIVSPIQYQQLDFQQNFEIIKKQEMTKISPNQFEMLNDFGYVLVNEITYDLNKIVLQRNSDFQISGISFPVQVTYYGKSQNNNEVQIIAFFEQSDQDNEVLFKLNFGLKNYKNQPIGYTSQIENFDMTGFFQLNTNNRFIFFEATQNQQQCDKTLYLIFYETFLISQRQIDEFEDSKISQIYQKQDNLKIFKSIQDDEKYIDLKQIRQQQQIYLNNLIIDQNLEIPQFEYKLKDNQNVQDKEVLDYQNTKIENFAVYQPPKGYPWGTIPQDCVMPWELEQFKLSHLDTQFLQLENFQAPLENYKYIPLYYYPSSFIRNQEQKLIYIPHLVMVNQEQMELIYPVNNLNIYIPALQQEKNIRLIKQKQILTEVENFLPNNTEIQIDKKEDKKDINYTDVINHLKKTKKKQKNKNSQNRGEQTLQNDIRLKKLTIQNEQDSVTDFENDKNQFQVQDNKNLLPDKIFTSFPQFKNQNVNQMPIDCIFVKNKLPKNSAIYDLKLPKIQKQHKIKYTKYVILYFCPIKDYSIQYSQLFIPVRYLTHKSFKLNSMKQEIPFIIQDEIEQNKFKVSYLQIQVQPETFAESLLDKSFSLNYQGSAMNLYSTQQYRKKYKLFRLTKKQIQQQKEKKQKMQIQNQIQEFKKNIMNEKKLLTQIPTNFDSNIIEKYLIN